MQSLLILGRQPKIGLAELESLYGADIVTPIDKLAALIDKPSKEIDFNRLGGSIKLCRLLNILDSTDWTEIEGYLSETIPEHLQYVPEGKLKLGLSLYGFKVNPRSINASALRLKKIIKSKGRSVRIIPNKTPELNSAQVLHNQLTTPNGWELVFVKDDKLTYFGITEVEQDIEAYSSRDQNRPHRDAKVGMLPPKLAQIIINLADPTPNSTVLDPFCGTGVILQEAALMGFEIYGTDLEPRMIEYSTNNLKWLHKTHGTIITATVEPGDATTHRWQPPLDAIASETYLGRPLSSLPPITMLEQIRKECDELHSLFLANIKPQLKTGTRVCLAVPAWRTKNGFLHLKTLDHLRDLGYTRLSFVHANEEDLIYHRPDQIVARELVILEKN